LFFRFFIVYFSDNQKKALESIILGVPGTIFAIHPKRKLFRQVSP
jgi:hypothetical protein